MAYELNTYLDDRILTQKTVPHTNEDAERIEAYLRWTGDSHFQKSVNKGERVPEEFFPKAVRFAKGKRLYDYQDLAGGLAVSRPFKDLVESFEPDMHQFVPVEVFHKDGSTYGTYWYFIICTMIDAINPVTGGVKKAWWVPESKRAEKPEAYFWDINWGSGKSPAVFAEKVASRAAWRDKRYPVPPFHSDAFVEQLKTEGMIGFQLVRHWQEI